MTFSSLSCRRFIVAQPLRALMIVALLCSASACSIGPESDARSVTDQRIMRPGASSDTDLTAAVIVWMVRDEHLVHVVRDAARPLTADALLNAVLAEPSDEERANGVTSALAPGTLTTPSDGTVPRAEEPARATAEIVLRDEFLAEPVSRQRLALGQVVLTLTYELFERVVFVDEGGSPVEVPTASGASAVGVVERADYEELAERITVDRTPRR